MSEEEKAKLEAEEAKANAEAKDDETEEENTEKSEAESKKNEYETQLKKEREARETAEKAAADLAFKLREKKRNESEEEEDKPLTERQLETILAREREATRKELQSAEIGRIAERLTGSEEEKNLVLELHKNRSFPSHLSIEEQIEECYVIANKKKLIGERNEALRALKSKGNNVAGTQQDEPSGSQPKLAPADASEYARLGFKWNGTNRQYEKKLSNGQMLVIDTKTKQTRLVKS